MRRRIGELLALGTRGFLTRLLRKPAFAAAVAAALLVGGAAHAIELSDVAAGSGGFAIEGLDAGDRLGSSVSEAGDVNGDGIPDLLIGASQAGESYVVFGKRDAEAVGLSEIAAGRGGFRIQGSGSSVSGAGDVNGDGLADVLIGASGSASYVVFGKSDGDAVELSEVAAGPGGFVVDASGRGSFLDVSGAGDVNGDGLADLVVGVQPPNRYGNAPPFPSESYVVFGKQGGEAVEISEVAEGRGGFVIRSDSGLGSSVSGAGDVNGDGLADLLIGASSTAGGYNQSSITCGGRSYVVFGKPDTEAVKVSDVASGRGGFGISESWACPDVSYPYHQYRYAWSVSGGGDVNGDGLADLLIGSIRGDAAESYVVFGKPDSERVELSEVAAGSGGFLIQGSDTGDRLGTSVSGARDVNGDGLADILLGAPDADPGGKVWAGESYVVFGKDGGETVDLSEVARGRGGFVLQGIDDRDHSGTSVSGAGDVNGDGLADIIIGAPNADPDGKEDAGEVYVVFSVQGEGEPRFRRGDTNTDNAIDIADAIFTLSYLFADGPVPTCLEAADANDDGQLDIADAIAVLSHLFANAGPLPEPFGECGVDQTADDLSCDSYHPCDSR